MAEGAAFRELPHLVFKDDPGNDRRRGRSAEQKAAGFWLDNHLPKGRSPSDPRRFAVVNPGLSHPKFDLEWTMELLERAATRAVRDPDWRLCLLVSLGWRVGVRGLLDSAPIDGGPPYLERAGGSGTAPTGVSRRRLDSLTRAFRDQLIAIGLASPNRDLEALEHEAPPSPAPPVTLVGWKAIAAFFRVSEDTAQRWDATMGLPVKRQRRGSHPIALVDELLEWARRHPAL